MSRTVHHVPCRHRRSCWFDAASRSFWSAHRITDLRYSGLATAKGSRLGRRPIPVLSEHAFVAYQYPRSTNSRAWSAYQQAEWRRRRRHDNRALGQLVRELDVVARCAGIDVATDTAFDVTPEMSAAPRDAGWEVS